MNCSEGDEIMKSRNKAVGLGSILTIIIGIGSSAATASGGLTPSAAEHAARSFEFSYRTAITSVPAATKHLEFWLPYPVSDANQEIIDISVVSPTAAMVYSEPRYGDDALYLSIDNPQPPINVELRFKVRRTEYIKKDFSNLKAGSGPLDPAVEQFLKPDKLVPIDGKVTEWAREVTKGKRTDLEKARAIYDYTVSTMKYDKTGQGWGRGDIYFACDAKRGNCTDFHAVFIGFCRAVGIPARFAIGFPLPDKRGEGEIAGYHCWAEFYLRGYGWVPVDASEASKHPEKKDYFFGAHDENRVQFSWGRDIILRPRQHSGPLNYFIYPLVEADGKTIDTIARELRFKDLSAEESARAF